MIHSTGTAQDDPMAYFAGFNTSTRKASVHGFISARSTGPEYVQTMPYNYRAWHCGGGGNDLYIGIEMCESDHMEYTGGASYHITDRGSFLADINRVTSRAVELCAELCMQYGWDPFTAITTHRQGHADGIASNHGDPDHIWCQIGMNLDKFKMEVFTSMNMEKRYNTVSECPSYAQDAIKYMIAQGALAGSSGKTDADGYPVDLDLSHDMIRTIVMMWRLHTGG